MRAFGWGLSLLMLGACAGLPTEAPVAPPHTREIMPGWTEFALPGKRSTRYVLAWEDGRRVVRARADASASMLRRRVRVDPVHLGSIEFSWRVSTLIDGADLNDADVSDSPVRLVLAFEGDHARLSARNRLVFDLAQAVSGEAPPFATLMYVWDNQAAPETVIRSRRTDRVRKIVLESGPERRDRWLHYRRDVVADFRRAFAEEPGALIGVALMTDADNTRTRAEGSYGEVRLLAPDGRLH
jgi:hypothetical protein